MSHILAIDLGTSSVKVALVNTDSFTTSGLASSEYIIHHPKPDYAEQQPDEWWQATLEASRKVLKNNSAEITAISLSGQMHGMVCLDDELNPFHPAVIWADGRSAKQVHDLIAFQKNSPSTLPGLPALGFAASTALWFKQNHPEILSKTAKWCLPKDYLGLKLTGQVVTDLSDAASTWLYDIKKEAWAEDVMAFCGLSASQMPVVKPSASIVGTLTFEAAEELGLASGIPVIVGTADLPAQALGQGIRNPDTILITVGSGGQLFIPTAEPLIDNDNYYVFNSNIANAWYIQGAILSAGLSLRWLRDLLDLSEQQDAYEYLSELSQSIHAGADGLIFLPYLAGERNAERGSLATGMFFGLNLHHQKAHLSRAVMEGVAFALKHILEQLPVSPQRFILAGGITQSNVWCQILADILSCQLEASTDNQPHGCIGASILAATALGETTIEAATSKLERSTKKIYTPSSNQIYLDNYHKYKQLHGAMIKVNS